MQLPCMPAFGAGSIPEEARVRPYQTQGSKDDCSGGLEWGKSDDGNHVMLQHTVGIIPYSPKYLEEL